MYMLPAPGAVLSFEACPYRVGIRFALLPLVAVYADSVCFGRTFFVVTDVHVVYPLGRTRTTDSGVMCLPVGQVGTTDSGVSQLPRITHKIQ